MKHSFLLKVMIAIGLAILAGWVTGAESPWYRLFDLIGKLFLNGLNLVVVPLVCASIVMGTARMGGEQTFRTLGARTFGFYLLTSCLAVVAGLCGFFTLLAGQESGASSLASVGNLAELSAQAQGDAFDKIGQILLRLVPANIFAAASQGQMLGLILFSILFGYFVSKIDKGVASIVMGFWEGIYQIMMKMTQLIMRALPIGVFGLVAKVVATTGIEAFSSLFLYVCTVLFSMLIFACVALPLLIATTTGRNPLLFFKAMAPALFTAFSTSSSAATLPMTMECIEKRAGISNRICSFTIPLGTSLNMCGGALNLCVSALFIAQFYGVELSLTTIGLIVFLSMITSMGVAGVPSASLISLMVILHSIGLPADGIGMIMAVDRILDMFRTTVNVLGNSTCTLLIASLTKDEQVLAHG